MQPQQQIIANTVTPQQHVTFIANTVTEETLKMRKKVIYALGKVELSIGCVMVAFGIFTSIYSSTYLYLPPDSSYYDSALSIGEGIWCGVLVIVAGGLGMGAGARTSTPRLINIHMGFSIGAIFASLTLSGLTATFSGIGANIPFYCALMSTMSIVSFATAVLLIVSASYCCCANPAGCCGQQAYTRGSSIPMPQYLNTPTVAPVQIQGPNPMTTTTTYYHQNPTPAQPGGSNMYYGNPGSAPSAPFPVKSDALNQGSDVPPAYPSN